MKNVGTSSKRELICKIVEKRRIIMKLSCNDIKHNVNNTTQYIEQLEAEIEDHEKVITIIEQVLNN